MAARRPGSVSEGARSEPASEQNWRSPRSRRCTSTRRSWTRRKQWYEKLVAVNPKNTEAYYTLGVIAWTKTVSRHAWTPAPSWA